MKKIADEMSKENDPNMQDLEREKKRRRLTKSLKTFTGSTRDNLKKARGWNELGAKQMAKISKEIKLDVAAKRYEGFETTYRNLCRKKNVVEDEVEQETDFTEAIDEGLLCEDLQIEAV